uniref:Uncharacterized protein n=1 Tax=Anguilla anguilla TaxID=7936 RepID=A0A0E9VL08_ANGAN
MKDELNAAPIAKSPTATQSYSVECTHKHGNFKVLCNL